MQTCSLYRNTKDARQQLFVAAAALHISSTGSTQEKNDYRADADEYWDDGWEPFFFNWNNVAPQVRRLSGSVGTVTEHLQWITR